MPIKSSSNNRILPPNTRAADVARRALNDLAAIQQRKHANAFEVDSYESVIYTRLNSGMPCSCMAHRKAVASLLDEDGKMPQGTINEFLTGGMSFKVNRYGQRNNRMTEEPADLADGEQTKALPDGQRRIVEGEYLAINLDDEFATHVDSEGGEAINGRVRPQTVDDLVADFDTDLALDTSTCTVCYGTGFVGGYTVLGGWRQSLSTQWETKVVTGLIETNQTPHAFYATQADFTITLPRGFVFLDTFRVFNNKDRVAPTAILLDNLPYSVELFAAFCDGRQHTISVQFEEPTYFTHLEVQVCQTRHPTRIDFPKFTRGSDLSVTDPTEAVSVNVSPLVPMLSPSDIIVESTFGKAFMVTSVEGWNDSHRNVQGWAAQARVLQESELNYLLPRRRKLSQRPTNMARDNVDGDRRT